METTEATADDLATPIGSPTVRLRPDAWSRPHATCSHHEPTPTGNGYWTFSALGCVEAFGDAAFRGDMRDRPLNGYLVGSVITPSGNGYDLVGQDGGIFTFGDVAFHGSLGDHPPLFPVVDVAVVPGRSIL